MGPILDPAVSAAHFFGTLPILPYKMGVDTPCECQYALGYYRPGNCAPYMIQPFPISARVPRCKRAWSLERPRHCHK